MLSILCCLPKELERSNGGSHISFKISVLLFKMKIKN